MNPVLSTEPGTGVLTDSLNVKDPFIQKISHTVTETIDNSENVPGLQSHEFNSIKTGIKRIGNK